MNVLEAYEKMETVKNLWIKKEPYSNSELEQVKKFLFEYYMSIENKLKTTEIDLWNCN